MSFIIGILITVIATVALFASLRALYQLWKFNALDKAFFKAKGLKFIILYSFWLLLLVGGILMISNHVWYPLCLKMAMSVLLLFVAQKFLGSLVAYTQYESKSEAPSEEEDEKNSLFFKAVKQAVLIDFLACLFVLGLTIIVFTMVK